MDQPGPSRARGGSDDVTRSPAPKRFKKKPTPLDIISFEGQPSLEAADYGDDSQQQKKGGGLPTPIKATISNLVEDFKEMRIQWNNRISKIIETVDGEEELVLHEHRRRPSNFYVANRSPSPSPTVIEEKAPTYTHHQMNLIREIQCFELSIRKIPKDSVLRDKLGICVKFLAQKCTRKKGDLPCRKCKVNNCVVCPHQFRCDCRPKYFNTQWCPHIHLARKLGIQNYKGQACLFIHRTYFKLTAQRHLRAFVLGPTKMWEAAPNLYCERFEHVKRTQIFKVKKVAEQKPCICEPDQICKRCKACACQWVCTCPDFWLYNQVCEHLHLVAMMRSENKDELFSNLGDCGENDEIVERPLKDPVESFYLAQEHMNSMAINVDVDITVVIPGEKWLIPSFYLKQRDDFPFVHTIVAHPEKDTLCICNNREKASGVNCCSICKICFYHFICHCEAGPYTICRHMHAIARLHVSKEAEIDYLNTVFVEEILLAYDSAMDITDKKFKGREPVEIAGTDTDPQVESPPAQSESVPMESDTDL